MTLHQLKILTAVARHLNFRRAAEELHVSQPSVFLQFKNLEQEYDLKLYQKNGRGIQLTHAGVVFASYAKEILQQVENLDTEFRPGKKAAAGEFLRIGSCYGLAVAFLPSLLARFTNGHPNVRLTLRTNSSRTIEQMVVDSELDIGVISYSSFLPSLAYEHCRREKIVAVAPKTYYAKKKTFTLEELSRIPVVVGGDGFFHERTEQIASVFNKLHLKPNIVLTCDSPGVLTATVKKGLGIGITYGDGVEPEIKRGNLKIIKVPGLNITVDNFAVYPKNKPLSPHAQEFLDLLRESTKKDSPSKSTVLSRQER